MACYPWWHSRFEAFRGLAYRPLCTVDEDPESRTYGFVPCLPEKLRAHAEKELNRLGVWRGHLALRTYALARNLHSETGRGTPEEKMAVALTTVNESSRRGVTVEDLVLLNGATTDERGCRVRLSKSEPITCRLPFFGKINDPVRGAVFGRFTASTREPDAEAMHIAAFALSGQAGVGDEDFVHGANDQADSSIIQPQRHARDKHQYWIGPLPGVDSKGLRLMKTMPEISPDSDEGRALIKRLEDECKPGPKPGCTRLPCPIVCRAGSLMLAEGDCVDPDPSKRGLVAQLGTGQKVALFGALGTAAAGLATGLVLAVRGGDAGAIFTGRG